MNSNLLEKRFGEMGARAVVSEFTPLPNVRPAQLAGRRIVLDIVRDRRGEFFTVRLAEGVEADVVNVDRNGRHLLLHVQDGDDKSKFLCGHDERHWFVAAVPEAAGGVTTVAKAMEALQPDAVRATAAGLRRKDRYSRRNDAFKRQGEWFFTPVEIDPPAYLVMKNEPITRGRGKPHVVEFLYRLPGETVYTSPPVRRVGVDHAGAVQQPEYEGAQDAGLGRSHIRHGRVRDRPRLPRGARDDHAGRVAPGGDEHGAACSRDVPRGVYRLVASPSADAEHPVSSSRCNRDASRCDGSTPSVCIVPPNHLGDEAQLAEQPACTGQVAGSTPAFSINITPP